MAADSQRLGVVVADDAYAQMSAEFYPIGIEFGAEVIVFDAADGALELAAVPNRHAAALGPQVEGTSMP